MSNQVYWEKSEGNRVLKCDHPLVERVWFWGGGAAEKDSKMFLNVSVKLIGGGTFPFYDINEESFETADIPQVESFLNSIHM